MQTDYFVHYRPLGKKYNGMYINAPWSDVAIQNVAKETTHHLEEQNKYISHIMNENNHRITENASTIINPRVMDDTIILNTSYIKEKDTKNFIKGYRERPIPKKKEIKLCHETKRKET